MRVSLAIFTVAAVITACSMKECPDEFELRGRYCYGYFSKELTWAQAISDCKNRGAKLAEPRNLTENNYIMKIAKTRKSRKVWLGANKAEKKETVKWDSDGQGLKWGFWEERQPNDLPRNKPGKCLEILMKWKKWNDRWCKTKSAYVCQADPKVDGGVSEWLEWSTCTKTCGGGTQTRNRLCNNPEPKNGGMNCLEKLVDTKNCGIQDCPIDGGVSEWLDWSTCTKTCGGGTQTRNRLCNNPEPKNGGMNCLEKLVDTQKCEKQDCPNTTTLQDTTALQDTTTLPDTTALPDLECKDGFLLLGDTCYHVSKIWQNWQNSKKTCKDLGGKLAEPRSPEEEIRIRGLVSYNQILDAWIGVHDLPSENKWIWASDGSAVDKTYWFKNEPDGARNQNCVKVTVNRPSISGWADVNCRDQLPFVCQKSAVR